MSFAVILLLQNADAWSNNPIASLIPPLELFIISSIAPSSMLIFSFEIIFSRHCFILSCDILLKSNLWHLEIIVAGIFCGSVVANINIIYSGGSSNVFNNALKAPIESIWTSSIIYTLYFDIDGTKLTLFFISLISSTPLFDAASISIISGLLLLLNDLQFSHSLQASPSLLFKQLIAFANNFALLVLPVPLGPVNKYAWLSLSFLITFFNVFTITSCPYTNSNVLGLYFLYNVWYAIQPPLLYIITF